MGIGGDPRAPRLCASRELQRSFARTRLVAGHEVAARRPAALRTLREPEICIAAEITPRGGRGGRWLRLARDLGRLVCGRRLHSRIGSFACLPRSYGHVAGCMGAQCVQGERTHHARPAGAKKANLIRCFGP
jgi:hypothetical protein